MSVFFVALGLLDLMGSALFANRLAQRFSWRVDFNAPAWLPGH